MTISIIYRTEVQVPEDVFRAFGNTPEFEREVLAITTHLPAAGQDAYGNVYIWGEGPVLSAVQRADAALYALMSLYKLKLEASHAHT